MKQITEEQGIAIIKSFQDKSITNLTLNDDELFSFKEHMQGKQFAYMCEAAIAEPLDGTPNRIGKLIEILKPEIDSIGKKPLYFDVLFLVSDDAGLQMDEMNAMNDFMEAYDDIEIKWTLNTIKNGSHTIKMRIITVTE